MCTYVSTIGTCARIERYFIIFFFFFIYRLALRAFTTAYRLIDTNGRTRIWILFAPLYNTFLTKYSSLSSLSALLFSIAVFLCVLVSSLHSRLRIDVSASTTTTLKSHTVVSETALLGHRVCCWASVFRIFWPVPQLPSREGLASRQRHYVYMFYYVLLLFIIFYVERRRVKGWMK